MLKISLHSIRIEAAHGLYAEEQVLGNRFEVDVDVYMNTNEQGKLPFVDYTIINRIVSDSFLNKGELLEKFVQEIHRSLKERFPDNQKISVTVRKLNPPMAGDVKYAQVCYEA